MLTLREPAIGTRLCEWHHACSHSAGQLVDAVALCAGRAGPAGTRIRAEALASPAPLITQPPVIAKQRQGPPVSKFPAGNTGRVYYSPSKDETRAGRRQNCAGTQAEGPLQAVVAAPSSSRPRSAAKTSETEPAGKRSPRGTNRSALHPMYKSELVRFCLSARSMKQGRCTGARPRQRSFQVGVFCRGTNARRTAVLRWHPTWEAQRTSMRTWDSPFSGLEHHPQRTLMGMAESGYVFSCGNFSNLRVFE